MNYFKTLLPANRIGVAIGASIIGIGLNAPVMGQTAVRGDLLGTPDNGMICRADYAGEFNSGNLKCSKSRFFFVSLVCDKSKFPTYVVRPADSPGTREGRDICTRTGGVRISSTDDVSQLTLGQDYVFAKVDTAAVTTQAAKLGQAEAAALGLNAKNDVDSTAGDPVIQPHPETGAKDRAVVQLTHYTFAIPTGRVAVARN